MSIFFYVIERVITNKNIFVYKLFYTLFAPYNNNKVEIIRICIEFLTIIWEDNEHEIYLL